MNSENEQEQRLAQHEAQRNNGEVHKAGGLVLNIVDKEGLVSSEDEQEQRLVST